MPYISSSIIFQLLGTVVPSLEKLQKEGETGRKKIQEWTRYATVPLVHDPGDLLAQLHAQRAAGARAAAVLHNTISFWVMGLSCAHRRLHLPDVARRADRRIRPGQRRQLADSCRHRRPHAQCDRMLITQTNFSARPIRRKPINIGQDRLPDRLVRLHRRRLDPDHPGAAAHPDSAGQAHARPPGLRRAASSSCRCASITAA